ncbi:hypothetical protein NKY44_08995 [Sinorhizobium meliloti]|uniref:hypothetical protein n=1 Tax=Rhizobium meliloti TaxID=382 RepID=UPI003D6519FE
MSMLRGKTIALSIGNAIDREKLGLPEREVNRVLFTLCTALIREGCQILYAGDLRAGGYTMSMFQFLAGTYAGEGITPFMNVLPEPAVRRLDFETLFAAAKAAHGVAEINLVLSGNLYPVQRIGDELRIGDKRSARPRIRNGEQLTTFLQGFPVSTQGFTDARRIVSELADGRVAMGGKMGIIDLPGDQYGGAMPGIAEEAILTLQLGKAFIPLAAFGGAARDAAIALELLSVDARTPRGSQVPSYEESMQQLRQMQEALPPSLLAPLRRLANNEGAEDLAQDVVEVLREWI